MAYTYSGDPSKSTRDYVRFVLGDTNTAAGILTDTEIDYLVGAYTLGNQLLAAAFRAAANALAAKLVKRSLGPQSEDATKRQAYYAEQADRYERYSGYSGVPSAIEYSADLIFDKNMMENEA